MRIEVENIILKMARADIPNSIISKELNVGIRCIQQLLKREGLNLSIKEAKRQLAKYNDDLNVFTNEIKAFLNETSKHDYEKTKGIGDDDIFFDKCDYLIYRFLDLEGNIIYVGKCEKAYHKDRGERMRPYFLRERVIIHSNNKKCDMFKKIVKIEYYKCNSKDEMLRLEEEQISFYKYKGQAFYNRQFKYNNNGVELEWEDTGLIQHQLHYCI